MDGENDGIFIGFGGTFGQLVNHASCLRISSKWKWSDLRLLFRRCVRYRLGAYASYTQRTHLL